MDRRQRKTRAAILGAFEALLKEKSYGRITVQDIIDAANVGRTTFYAHFETKDELLKALCEELFGHVVQSAEEGVRSSGLYSDESAPCSTFCHLLQHLERDDGNVLELLSCESNEPFMRYFKDSLGVLVRRQLSQRDMADEAEIPRDFLVNHIASSFVEMVLWWVKGGKKQSPEELALWFSRIIGPVI